MADSTFRGVFPPLKAIDNGDGTFSVAAIIPGMPPLTGLTAGELLVATGATTAAWQNTGVKLTAPDIQGVVTAAGLLTMPAFKMGGALTLNGQVLDAGASDATINTTGNRRGLKIISTQDGGTGPWIFTEHVSASPAVGDILLQHAIYGRDNLANQQVYAEVDWRIVNKTHGSEEASVEWWLANAPALDLAMTLSGPGVLSPLHSILFGETVDSALVADEVSLGGYDIAPGERSLAISQENPVVTEAIGASDRTLPVRINGVNYKILLKA